jgi:hypothetical protein
MKTPEKLAEEWLINNQSELMTNYDSFLAGYKAAQEHAHAALEEAEVNSDKAYHQGLKDGAPQWISVKDKSPEINQRVLLATNEKRSIVTGYRLPPAGKNEPWFHTDLGLWCGTETVTHWQELPEPPKEEK